MRAARVSVGSLGGGVTDKRLLGKWKSDKRKSLRELRARADVTPEFLALFRNTAGKLTFDYRPKTMVVSGIGDTTKGRYEVVAADDESVVLQGYHDLLQSNVLTHIFFDGNDSYWVPMGKYREWFRRVK